MRKKEAVSVKINIVVLMADIKSEEKDGLSDCKDMEV